MGSVPDYSSFFVALQNTHVNMALGQPGPFTVFAPVNSAFTNYAPNLATLFADIGQLSAVVLLHVIHGEYRPDQLVHGMTLVTFNGPITVQRYGDYIALVSTDGTIVSNVVGSGYASQNGYVYGVDTIISGDRSNYPNQNPPTIAAPSPGPLYTAPPTAYLPPLGANPTCANSADACATNGRLQSITFRYGNFNAVAHQQDAAFPAGYVQEVAYAAGTVQLPTSVEIKINGRNDACSANGWKFTVGMGESFTLLGTAFGGVLENVYVIKVNGRKIKFKANCGAPIGLGDQFGALVVVGFETTGGSVCALSSAGASSLDTPSSASPRESKSYTGTEIAAIVAGCVAAIGLIAFTVYIKTAPTKRMFTTHD
jgi:hypothetical protein